MMTSVERFIENWPFGPTVVNPVVTDAAFTGTLSRHVQSALDDCIRERYDANRVFGYRAIRGRSYVR
jgi:hypothetical protein